MFAFNYQLKFRRQCLQCGARCWIDWQFERKTRLALKQRIQFEHGLTKCLHLFFLLFLFFRENLD